MNYCKVAWPKWVAFSPYTGDLVAVEAPFNIRGGRNGERWVTRDAAVRAARIKRRPLKSEPKKKRRWP